MTKARVYAQPDAVAGRNLTELLEHIHRTGIYRDLQFVNARQRRIVDHIGSKDDRVAVGFRIVSMLLYARSFNSGWGCNYIHACSRIGQL